MEKFNIKSIIMGIGIGIVITSFISIIYLAGGSPKVELSDEEIIREALQLGMVKAEDAVKNDDAQKNKNSGQIQDNMDNIGDDTSVDTSKEKSRLKTVKISDGTKRE